MNQQSPQAVSQPRPEAEINQEYTDVCTQIGDKQYKLRILDKEIRQLIARQEALDVEAATAKQAAAAQPKQDQA